jgi:hydrocephalus-inducing protein
MEGSFGPHFSIMPLQGKVSPGDEVMFEVVFNPAFTDDDIRQDNIMLAIPGMTPLSVTCSGVCISQPSDSIQTLSFSSAARKEQVQSIKVNNPSDRDWYVQPSMRGDHWIRTPELKVPAKGAADLQLTYFPLTMTTAPASGEEGQEGSAPEPHAGQLFLALPDGTAQLYNLEGTASEPECSGSLSIETPAKKPARCTIKLANWLGEVQKFATTIEMLEQPSPATFLIAANAIEIGPYGQREFHTRFTGFVEGTTKARVTFTNPTTGEYCFYDIHATTTTPEVLETITMEAPVRQSSRYILTVENPLDRDAEIIMGTAGGDQWWSCDNDEIRVSELSPLQGNTEGQFEVEYRPLKPTTEPRDHLLTLMSTSLGTFKYKINVTATQPTLKQTLNFEVPLGSSQELDYTFTAFGGGASATTEVKNEGVFQVAKTVSIGAASDWNGVQVKVPVKFEPTDIGSTHDTLTLSTPDGGRYTCELVAECIAPLPQGPFDLTPGANRAIDFRNCFDAGASFAFSVDSSHYKVGSASATVGAKSNGSVTVSFSPTEEAAAGSTISAKLFVQCVDRPDVPPWVYYLRGKV